ncbi:MAG: flagellar filament capping protein FliD [Alphaproteobacteria bacterium]
MALTTNTSKVSTDANGRTIFSGVTSGIDAKSIVDNIVKARQFQIDKITATMDAGKVRIAALDKLRGKSVALGSAVSELYGKVSFDKSGSVFDRKTLSATTSRRVAGILEAASSAQSPAADIVNVTSSNTAAKASHDIEVLEAARAHVRKAVFATSGALGLSGTVAISSSAIVETARSAGADVAAEIAARINGDATLSRRLTAEVAGGALVVTAKAAGVAVPFSLSDATAGTAALPPTSGVAAATGVRQVQSWSVASLAAAGRPAIASGTASIGGQSVAATTIDFTGLSVSEGQEFALRLGDPRGTTLRVSAGAGATPASIAAAFKARIDALAGTTASTEVSGGELRVAATLLADAGDVVAATSQWRAGLVTEVAVAAGDTLGDLRARINGTNEGTAASGLVASQIAVSATEHQLLFSTDVPNHFLSVEMRPDAGTAATFATETIEKPSEARILLDGAIVRRPVNVVDDAIAGLTIKILQAEPQTRIRLNVGTDTGAIAQKVAGFVAAYNDAMRFANEQSQFDPVTGTFKADSVLAKVGVLRDLKSTLEALRTFSVASTNGLLGLQDIGISVSADAADPLGKGALQVDESKLTDVLINDPERVRDLFELKFSPDGSDISLAGFGDKAKDASGSYTLSFSGGVASLKVSGGGTIALSRSGSAYTAASGPIEGMSFIYTGATTDGDKTGFAVRTGLGTQLFFLANQYARPETGRVAQSISEVDDLNAKRQARIEALRERLERQRETLMARFQKMESTLGRLSSVRSSIEQFVQAKNKGG